MLVRQTNLDGGEKLDGRMLSGGVKFGIGCKKGVVLSLGNGQPEHFLGRAKEKIMFISNQKFFPIMSHGQ